MTYIKWERLSSGTGDKTFVKKDRVMLTKRKLLETAALAGGRGGRNNASAATGSRTGRPDGRSGQLKR